MKINLNDTVTIKLRPSGEKMLLDYWASAKVSRLDDVPGYRGNGLVRMSLHEMARIFGPALFLGNTPPIETAIEVDPCA